MDEIDSSIGGGGVVQFYLGSWMHMRGVYPSHMEGQRLAFLQEFFQGGAKSIVMQVSFVMLIFYCYRTRFQGGAKVSEGASCLRGRLPVEESQAESWSSLAQMYFGKRRASRISLFWSH